MDDRSRQKWEAWASAHSSPLESVERSADPAAIEIILEDIARKLELRRGDRLLDVGCGAGVVLQELGRRHGLETAGVDFALAQLRLGLRNFPGLWLAQAAAEGIPFVDGTFDKILSYGVFHYVDDWRGAIDGFIRATRGPALILIGDLPSARHKHRLYLGYVRRLPAVLRSLSTFRQKLSYTRDTSHWHWLDLKEMKSYVEGLGHEARILPQPAGHRQYGGVTHTYRFDLLIRVKR